MALAEQSYLPIMYENMVRGMMPITPQTFDGDETSISLNDMAYPLRRYTYHRIQPEARNDLRDKPVDFMGIPIGATDDRINYVDNILRLDNMVEGIHQWKCLHGIARYDVTYGPLMLMLQASGNTYPSTPSVPPLSASDYAYSWYINYHMAMLPKFAFVDFNWIKQLAVDSGTIHPASITIDAPTEDPGNGTHIKLMLVNHNPEVINGVMLNSTLRFIKITAGAASTGNYVWPVTIQNTDGDSISAQITLTVE